MGATYISADRIADALGRRTATAAPSVMRATVAEVPAEGIVRVYLDGAAVGDTTECGAYCSAEKGDRVAVVRMPDGRCIATGRRGGDTWETLAGKPETFPPAAHTHPEFGSAHIEASGTSGIWRYVKWSDGTAMCMGRYKSSINIGTKYDAYHYYSPSVAVSLPFAFAEQPNFIGSTGALSYVAQDTGVTGASKVGLYVVRPSSGTITYIDLIVWGRWR